MKRDFLESLGLDKEVVDKILAENGSDIEREKAKTTQAKADLADAKAQLESRDRDLADLKKNTGDAADVQAKLDELQAKYDKETKDLQAQLADRDYTDAITKAIAGANEGKGLHFSSKFAQTAFEDALRKKGLELKDGVLTGFDDFVKAQKEADPDAFAGDKPAARFAGPVGVGGRPVEGKSRAAQIAEEMHNNLYGAAKKE